MIVRIEIEAPFAIVSDDAESNRVVAREIYRIGELGNQPSDGLIAIDTVFADDYPLPDDERFPLELRADGRVEHEIEVEYAAPPPLAPSEESIVNAHFAYIDRVRVEGCVLRFYSRATPQREVVAASDLPAYREEVERMLARCSNIFAVAPPVPRAFGWELLAAALLLSAAIIGVIDMFT